MFCVKCTKWNSGFALFNFVQRYGYSRRSDKSTSTYHAIKTNGETLDDMDNGTLGIDLNWELFTPRGFRFYLPGSVGPGWLDTSTTASVSAKILDIPKEKNVPFRKEKSRLKDIRGKNKMVRPVLQCVAQECPLLLRKGIKELFHNCHEVNSSHLTIVTISQTPNFKMLRWSKEAETERLAKYFVLAASDICSKLKMIGYWADFVNPFSGQPHVHRSKNGTLYKTDERFRCLGFKIESKNNCRVISCDSSVTNFLGSLYTTAPANIQFLKEIMSDCKLVNVEED